MPCADTRKVDVLAARRAARRLHKAAGVDAYGQERRDYQAILEMKAWRSRLQFEREHPGQPPEQADKWVSRSVRNAALDLHRRAPPPFWTDYLEGQHAAPGGAEGRIAARQIIDRVRDRVTSKEWHVFERVAAVDGKIYAAFSPEDGTPRRFHKLVVSLQERMRQQFLGSR